MKRFMCCLSMFALLAGAVFGQRTIAPAVQGSTLSFSVIPSTSMPFGPDGGLGSGISAREWFGQGWGLTASVLYHPGASPWLIGADIGYSWVPYADWRSSGLDPFAVWYSDPGNSAITRVSILQAGLVAGFQWNLLPAFGMRALGSFGYSYNVIGRNASAGGTPVWGAGAELFWTVVPAISLTAGTRYRHFVDMYGDMAFSLGVAYNVPVGRKPIKPAPGWVAPQPAQRSDLIEKLTSFLAPKHQQVSALCSEITSAVQEKMNRGIDKNVQSAIAVHDAFRLLGITCDTPPDVPPGGERRAGALPEPTKLPFQTLHDGKGNCSDLSTLYISLLSSVPVETAFITTSGHVFVAVALACGPDEAREAFGSADDLVFRDGKAWMPIDVTRCGDSFVTAWRAGAQEWRQARKQARLHVVRRDISTPEPAAGAAQAIDEMRKPDPTQLAKLFQDEAAQLVAQEIRSREAELLAAVSATNGSPRSLNALGVLYARCDLLDKAQAQFLSAVEKSEYVPALLNLGSVSMRGKLFEKALAFYNRAAAVAPQEPAVLLGLARSNYELGNYVIARERYLELEARSPEIGRPFWYLRRAGWADQEARESGVKDLITWEEEK